jgi:hypothetical protein
MACRRRSLHIGSYGALLVVIDHSFSNARELLVETGSIELELHPTSLQLLSVHVPEGPVASVGGLLILGERGHDSGDGSNGAGSQQAGGGRGKGLYRVDNHDEGSVV